MSFIVTQNHHLSGSGINLVSDKDDQDLYTMFTHSLRAKQSGLTPRKETRLFLTKNHNGITKFGNGITENRNYIAEVHSDPDLANLLSIL